jgi:hypothetical protein
MAISFGSFFVLLLSPLFGRIEPSHFFPAPALSCRTGSSFSPFSPSGIRGINRLLPVVVFSSTPGPAYFRQRSSIQKARKFLAEALSSQRRRENPDFKNESHLKILI